MVQTTVFLKSGFIFCNYFSGVFCAYFDKAKIKTLNGAVSQKKQEIDDKYYDGILNNNTEDGGHKVKAQPINIVCEPCHHVKAGGYYNSDSQKITLCENYIGNSRTHIEHTITHELIHAYDDFYGVCGTSDFDWKNCKHRACSEVRAAAMSGDCNYIEEVKRGNFNPVGFYERCVKRRAELSQKLVKMCQQTARSDTQEVFTDCMIDHRPFDCNKKRK